MDASDGGGGAGTEHIMTWRKQGHEVPIFIQFNGYPPHVDESYQGRTRLVEMTAIEISDLRAQDEGWYECSVVRLEGTDESTVNGSWIYLTINCTYLSLALLYNVVFLSAFISDSKYDYLTKPYLLTEYSERQLTTDQCPTILSC